MSDVIDMVKCVYCDEVHVAAETIVCETCTPKIQADLAIVDIDKGITLLECTTVAALQERKNLINTLVNKLLKIQKVAGETNAQTHT